MLKYAMIDGACQSKGDLEALLKVLDPQSDPKTWAKTFNKWRRLDREEHRKTEFVCAIGKLLHEADSSVNGAALLPDGKHARISFTDGGRRDVFIDGYSQLEIAEFLAFYAGDWVSLKGGKSC